MFYIHKATCISPQHTFLNADINRLNGLVNNKLHVVEPAYEGIPPGILRRMGKASRMGVGAALPLVQQSTVEGIIIGTANGGMEDCIKFLNQIIQYDEGMLTPGNFVQSTPNAIAAQVGLLTGNKGYNITHVQRGLSFENALIDADMMLSEFPGDNYIVGGVDEISAYNYNIENLGGWYKKEAVSNGGLYDTNSSASIAGEGVAMFLVNGLKSSAIAQVEDVRILHSESVADVKSSLSTFMEENMRGGKIDLLISGENGDIRLQQWYSSCEALMDMDVTVARFKHMSGEYPTASAFALWLGCYILEKQALPDHVIKSSAEKKEFNKILIYNTYKGVQHSFMLLSGVH